MKTPTARLHQDHDAWIVLKQPERVRVKSFKSWLHSKFPTTHGPMEDISVADVRLPTSYIDGRESLLNAMQNNEMPPQVYIPVPADMEGLPDLLRLIDFTFPNTEPPGLGCSVLPEGVVCIHDLSLIHI